MIERAGSQGTDVRRRLTHPFDRLRKQMGHGGLAVSAGHCTQLERCRWRREEAIGERAELLAQLRTVQHRHIGPQPRQGTFGQYRAGATRDGVGCVATTIVLLPAQRHEATAGAHLTAVESQVFDLPFAASGHLGDVAQQAGERHAAQQGTGHHCVDSAARSPSWPAASHTASGVACTG